MQVMPANQWFHVVVTQNATDVGEYDVIRRFMGEAPLDGYNLVTHSRVLVCIRPSFITPPLAVFYFNGAIVSRITCPFISIPFVTRTHQFIAKSNYPQDAYFGGE